MKLVVLTGIYSNSIRRVRGNNRLSSFGFTFLSRMALGQAEQMMFGANAGVRDEVGFLIVHQRYADHLFPGTSVLHTRLRYTLLIPWLYQSLRAKRPVPKDFAKAFIDLEHDLTRRLQFKDGAGEPDGVIGGEVYPRIVGRILEIGDLVAYALSLCCVALEEADAEVAVARCDRLEGRFVYRFASGRFAAQRRSRPPQIL